MSWQPLVEPAPVVPGNRTGAATTAALVGASNGTLMIETLSCGGLQYAPLPLAGGPYDWT